MLRQPEFSVVLFVICLVIFSWPVLSIPGVESPRSMFYYLFFQWAVVIFLLFLLGLRDADLDKSDDRHS